MIFWCISPGLAVLFPFLSNEDLDFGVIVLPQLKIQSSLKLSCPYNELCSLSPSLPLQETRVFLYSTGDPLAFVFYIKLVINHFGPSVIFLH